MDFKKEFDNIEQRVKESREQKIKLEERQKNLQEQKEKILAELEKEGIKEEQLDDLIVELEMSIQENLDKFKELLG